MSDRKLLIEEAYQAREMAYTPYSGFRVGAALRGRSGRIYRGCNIENGAYSPTNCAERTAFFKAVSVGEQEFTAIAVVGYKEGDSESFCFPCGVCRQVMAEFCGADFQIFVTDGTGNISAYTLGQLLPESFSLK